MSKSLSSTVAAEAMTSPAAHVMTETPLGEIANLLLRDRISAVSVLDDSGDVVGLISEGDLVRRSSKNEERRSWWLDLFEAGISHPDEFLNYLREHGLRAKDVMTASVISVSEETPIVRIAELFESNRIKQVPVLRRTKLVGIVSRADLLRVLVAGSPVHGHVSRASAGAESRRRRGA
jgi:CBS domain-containing protein